MKKKYEKKYEKSIKKKYQKSMKKKYLKKFKKKQKKFSSAARCFFWRIVLLKQKFK